jgi:hypothetical protein
MESNDEQKLKIAYLFLAIDGQTDEALLSNFDLLGQKFDDFASARGKIIRWGKQSLTQSIDGKDRDDVISEKIIKLADPQPYSYPVHFAKDKAECKQCLWMLVNLAWHDGGCSDKKKKLLRTLMRKWNIDKSVLLEMEDTAETLSILDHYRTWVKTTEEPYGFIDAVVKELDKNQQEIAENIADLVSFEEE